MVIALVMVTAPNPPGSSASISPLAAVFEIAPAKVLHGAVRLHGLASSPTPDTQVRWPGTGVGSGPEAKFAETLVAPLTVRTQSPAPPQTPPQPAKWKPVAALAASVTS